MLIGILLLVAALALVVWLFLIFPRMGTGADMELLRADYAHRGLHDGQIPENSLSAFTRAMQAGYGIELDIQPSKDGRVMVFHDDNLRRMCGVDARVRDLTYEELRRLRLKGTGEVIPTLDEVLQLVCGRVPLMIEIKGEKADAQFLLPAAELLDTYMGPFCVESFSPLILSWFKSFRPSFARGQLVTKPKPSKRKGSRLFGFLLSGMMLNVLSRPDFVSVHFRLRNRPAVLFCTHFLKKTTFLWTVRTPEEYKRSRKEGYRVIFEGFLPPRKKR